MMKKFLPFLLLCFFYSCKKKDAIVLPVETSPATITTSIKGMISPADAVATIAVNDGNKTIHSIIPDANGAFSMTGLPSGSYTINYSVTPAYLPQSAKTLTLIAGQTLDLGKLVFAPGTGNLEGSTAPAGAAVKVTVTNTTTKNIYSVVPDATTGKYKFSALPGGIYNMSYTVNAPSLAPADATLTVGINQDLSLPPVVFKTPGLTGTVSGIINPSGSANVYLFNQANNYGVVVFPDQGKFVSPDLLPGTYEISFPAGAPYQSPPSQLVTLAPGQSLDLGSISIPTGLYLIRLNVDGTNLSIGHAVANINYNAPKLTISAANSAGGLPVNNTNNSSFSLAVDNLTGPGTYELKGTSISYMTYASGSSLNPSRWGMADGGTATVIITAIDPVKRIITGSFSARLKPQAKVGSDLIITNGVINVSY